MATFKKNDDYYEYSTKAFEDAGIITASEREFYDNARIPYAGDMLLWFRLYSIHEKMASNLDKVKGEKLGGVSVAHNVPGLITDYIAGPNGAIIGQHDGKHYDSKSEYYKSLKASGHIVHEAGMHKEKREQRGDYNCRKELKEAAQKAGIIG